MKKHQKDTNKKMMALRFGDTFRENVSVIQRALGVTQTRAIEIAVADCAKRASRARRD